MPFGQTQPDQITHRRDEGGNEYWEKMYSRAVSSFAMAPWHQQGEVDNCLGRDLQESGRCVAVQQLRAWSPKSSCLALNLGHSKIPRGSGISTFLFDLLG